MSISDEIKSSGLFDPVWYLDTYKDVGISGIQPLVHFVRIGMKIGRNPGPLFDNDWYKSNNPDCVNSGLPPLLHYIRIGKGEGRQATPTTGVLGSAYSEMTTGIAVAAIVEEKTAGSKRATNQQPSVYKLKIESVRDGVITGWAAHNDDPTGVFDLELLVDGYSLLKIQNNRQRNDLRKQGLTSGLGGIKEVIPTYAFGPGSHQITLRAPNGQTVDTTIMVDNMEMPSLPSHELTAQAEISVVIPVYDAADDLVVCIDRLARFTAPWVDILFIDDCSPDPKIRDILEEAVAAYGNMRALFNEKNLGFSGTINRGIAETGHRDLVMLNSDARVTPGWLEGLWMAAYSAARIGTATAMSDRAGAFSAPRSGNDNVLSPDIDEISFGRAFRRASLGLYPRVPTGNGFCMYVRRACLDEVGILDQSAFPQGYGEENDFCMRALRAGWQHVIDDRTYVFHDRAKSFGAKKTDLMAAGRATVDSRYPEYTHAIRVFNRSSKIACARMTACRAVQSLLSGEAQSPRLLFVVSTKTGGTPQTNGDLMRALDGDMECWVLVCNSEHLELSRLEGDQITVVQQHKLKESVDPITHVSAEYDHVLRTWLLAFDFDLIHIRHLGWHSLTLPAVAKSLNRRVVFSFHDYYMLTPTVKMLDDVGVYLGNTFSPEAWKTREGIWPPGSQPDPTGSWLAYWRTRNAEALSHCDAYITTSESARRLILEHLPTLEADRFLVIPHGRDFDEFRQLANPEEFPNEPIRILVPGNLDRAKGLDLILEILRLDVAGRLEFHVLGTAKLQADQYHPRLVLHGGYSRDQFADRVTAINVSVGAVLSIWDETYCHTLTEMWSVGLPVIVLDMPNVAQRVRDSGAGWVLSDGDVESLYQEIVDKVGNQEEWRRATVAVRQWQTGYGAAYGTRIMAAQYLECYRGILRNADRSPRFGTQVRVAVVCPAERSLRRANPSTIIRIWERCRNTIDRDLSFVRMTPEALLSAVKLRLINIAVIQRTAIPEDLVQPILTAAEEANINVVLDIDDDLLNVPASKDGSGTYRNYKPQLRQLLSKAAVVTVSTPYLQTQVANLVQRTELLPNRLSDRLWKNQIETKRKKEKSIRALYMGTRTHDDDLRMILPALDVVAERQRHFRCTLIGVATQTQLVAGRENWLEILAIPDAAKTYEKFVPWLLKQASNFDFGIAPLEDTDFNRAKSALKLLDYAGMGLPVLASDVSAYHDIATSAAHVALVQNTKDLWISALAARIRQGQRSEAENTKQREWLYGNGMLHPELPAFDSLLMSLVRGVEQKGEA